MCVTVDRSTFHFSAASRCVACPVSTDTKISYFSDGASRRRDLDEGLRVTEFTLRSDTVISLQTRVTRRLVAGYFLPLLSHEVRRKAMRCVEKSARSYVCWLYEGWAWNRHEVVRDRTEALQWWLGDPWLPNQQFEY